MGEPSESSDSLGRSGTVPPVDPGGRYHALDAMRAAMMLLGILLHTLCSYVTFELGDDWRYVDPATSFTADVLLGVIHPFRMPAFFLVAGFFAALLARRRGLESFLDNRVRRIAIPLLLAYLLILPTVHFAFEFSIARVAGREALEEGLRSMLGAPYRNQLEHLWFLYYLLYYYAAAWLTVRTVPSALSKRVAAWFGRLVESRWLTVTVTAPLAALQLTMPGGLIDASTTFVPNPSALAAYGTFFAVGSLLYGARDRLTAFERGLGPRIALGLVVLVMHLALSIQTTDLINTDTIVLRPEVIGCAVTGALTAWMLTFSVLGLFLKYAAAPSPAFRYASDASYWVYLVHMTFAALLPSLVQWLPAIAELRIAAVVVLDALICFASYALFVRGTVIGRLLSGRVYPPGLPRAAVGAHSA